MECNKCRRNDCKGYVLFIIVLSEPGKFYIATYRSLDERRLAIIFRKVYIIF